MGDNDRLVYSTGPDGKVSCPNCGKTPCECAEGLAGEVRKRNQTEPVRISFKKTGKGSGLTLVERLPMHPAGKEELLSKFKKRLGERRAGNTGRPPGLREEGTGGRRLQGAVAGLKSDVSRSAKKNCGQEVT